MGVGIGLGSLVGLLLGAGGLGFGLGKGTSPGPSYAGPQIVYGGNQPGIASDITGMMGPMIMMMIIASMMGPLGGKGGGIL